MINLLPEDRKREIHAARANVLLLRYNFLTLGVVVILIVLCIGAFVILQESKQTALATIGENERKTAALADVRKAANEYQQNLALASKIIDNGVSYTNIVIAITKLMPAGAVLDGLSLAAATGTGTGTGTAAAATQQITFQAQAKDYTTAEKLKQSFQSSPLFSNVYFQGLTENTDTTGNYTIRVTMNAVLNLNAKLDTDAKQK